MLSRLLELLFLPILLVTKKTLRNIPIRTILLIEPFNLGDLVSLSVMLDPLRRRFPQSEIHLLVKPLGINLYKHDSRIAMIHPFKFPWAEIEKKFLLGSIRIFALIKMIRELRSIGFDIGIDTRGDIRSHILMVLLGCKIRVGFTNYLCSNLKIRGFLLTHNAGHLQPQQRWHINLSVLRLLGCMDTKPVPGLMLPLKAQSMCKTLKILCHPGASWVYRRWKADRWVALIRKILANFDVEIVVTGDKNDLPLMNEIQGQVSQAVAFVNTSLQRLQMLIQTADLVICLDSGPMHIAAAYGVPLIALFGPGFKEIWHPLSSHSCIIDHQDLYPCAPCLQKRCIFPKANCMDAITSEEVFEKASEIILDIFKRKHVENRK